MEQFFESRRTHFSLPLVWVSFSSFFEKLFWNDHCKLPVCNLWLTPHCLLKWLKLLKLVNNVIFIWVLLTSSLLLIWWKVKVLAIWSCSTLSDPMDYSLPGSSVHAAHRQEYWSGLPFSSQGIFPTQGSHLGLLQFRHIQVSCSSGRFLTIWATIHL